MPLPAKGIPKDELLARMRERKRADADWRGGRTFSLVYPAGHDVDEILREAAELYLFENALNPFRFPSLRQMEDEVVALTAELLHAGPGAGGAMTSGGTESILMRRADRARARARRARRRRSRRWSCPFSAHPAFAKAAHYLGIELRQVPLLPDCRADVAAAAKLINENTALVVGSAPNYPFGVVDPIPELAALAAARGIAFHTDSCLGGFLLPFLESAGRAGAALRLPRPRRLDAVGRRPQVRLLHQGRLRHPAPRQDAPEPASAVPVRSLARREYGSFAMAGARPSGPIAAAWAVLHYLGRDGYLRLAREVRDTTRKLRSGIDAIPGLRVLGDPVMSVLAFGSDRFDVFAVGDAMDARGWHLDRQKGPAALHLMVSPMHAKIADALPRRPARSRARSRRIAGRRHPLQLEEAA